MRVFAARQSGAPAVSSCPAGATSPLRTVAIEEHLARLAEATSAADGARTEIEQAEQDAQIERERVAAAYARGELELEQAEERTAALDVAAERAKRRASVTVSAVGGLRSAGAQLVSERAAEVDETLADEESDAEVECDRLRAELAAADERRGRIELRRREVAQEARHLLAEFDTKTAEVLRDERHRDATQVDWAIKQGASSGVLAQVPSRLHNEIIARYEEHRASVRGW